MNDSDLAKDQIRVAVVYAKLDSCIEIELSLPLGTTVVQAISASKIMARCAEIDSEYSIGVYGKIVDRNRVLEDQDRVEIYRKLIADPKDARRKRARIGHRRR